MPGIRRKRRFPLRLGAAGRLRRFRNISRVAATSSQPIFSEMYKMDEITAGTGGTFTFSMSQVPEHANYGVLYRNFRILKAQVLIIPNHNVSEVTVSPVGLGRFTFAVNNSPNVPDPTTEADVLVDNGAKVKMLTRPMKINCTPYAQLTQGVLGGGTTFTSRSKQYLDFDSGQTTPHKGISWWYSNNGSGANQTAQLYYKVTFQLRDPR